MFPFKRVHLIGIGGIGISAIAKLLHSQGVMVTGSDMADGEMIQELILLGIPVSVGESDAAIAAAADAVIYSEAVPEKNAERVAARTAGKLELSGGAFLAQLTEKYKTICVAGTHGKSTTTAMVGLIMEAAGLDPTVIVGSKVPGFPLGNVRVGKGEWLVLEADEYAKKFLQYHPHIAVITNVEHDHPDVYPTEALMVAAFQEFVGRVVEGGTVILNADSPAAVGAENFLPQRGSSQPAQHIRRTFSISHDADVAAHDRIAVDGGQKFSVRMDGAEMGEVVLRVPGRINVSNALAAIAASQAVGVSFADVAKALAAFQGIWRRFEYVGRISDSRFATNEDWPIVISDYGHHPTAVHETISAARETYPHRRIILAFQPHQRSRTVAFRDAFIESLLTADIVLLPEIYAPQGRDLPADAISSQVLADAVNARVPGKAVACADLDEAEKQLHALIQARDVVIVMGAGDIDSLARLLVK